MHWEVHDIHSKHGAENKFGYEEYCDTPQLLYGSIVNDLLDLCSQANYRGGTLVEGSYFLNKGPKLMQCEPSRS